jgi:hypothetical protein
MQTALMAVLDAILSAIANRRRFMTMAVPEGNGEGTKERKPLVPGKLNAAPFGFH